MKSKSNLENNPMAHVLLLAVAARWMSLLVVSLICAVAAGAWQLSMHKDFRAAVLLSGVSSDTSTLGGLAGAMGQLSPLTSLVGLTGLGSGGQRPEPLAILQSRALTMKFITDNNLMPVLFQSRWDSDSSTWKPSWLHKDPTLLDGFDRFNKLRRVSQDSKTNLISLTITWSDPKLAANWANSLVQTANQYLRQRSLEEARRNIAYLSDQLGKTTLIEMRTALGSLIQAQVKQQMLAEGTEEFAFKVLDPALAPQEPSSPGLVISVVCGLIAGALLFIFLVFSTLIYRGLSGAEAYPAE
jgi:uncharacterized protein involved in exopolysaccharide biosynthesis